MYLRSRLCSQNLNWPQSGNEPPKNLFGFFIWADKTKFSWAVFHHLVAQLLAAWPRHKNDNLDESLKTGVSCGQLSKELLDSRQVGEG